MNFDQWCEEKRGRAAWLARQLKVEPTTVSDWRSGKKPIPSGRCPTIERLTEGAVTCEEMFADVEWAFLRNTSHVTTPRIGPPLAEYEKVA